MHTICEVLPMQSPDTVVVVQHEDKLASILCFRGCEFDGPPSTVCSLAPMGRCLPLVPISKPKHVVESYEAMNMSMVHKNIKTTIYNEKVIHKHTRAYTKGVV